jgi:ABC-type multidrug transport system permease subunit
VCAIKGGECTVCNVDAVTGIGAMTILGILSQPFLQANLETLAQSPLLIQTGGVFVATQAISECMMRQNGWCPGSDNLVIAA